MGLPGNSITTWAQMLQTFNDKYRDYYRSKDTKEEIFRMTMGSDESLEDYEERFYLSYKRATCTLDPKSLKLVLLKGILEYPLDTLHLLVGRDIYQLSYEDKSIVFRNHFRVARKKGRGSQPIASTSSSNSSIKREVGNMLEDFKSEMLQALAMQMNTLHIKRKQEEAEKALAIFCPRCTMRHPRNECPLNSIEVCLFCEEDHSIDKCPSLPGRKAVYQGAKGATEPLYFMNQRRPHGPRPYQQGMQGTYQAYYHPNQVTFIPSWGPPAHPSWSTPPPWSITSPCHAQPATYSFQSYAHPNLSGMHLIRGGGPSTTLLPLFFLHHLLNHNHYLLLHQGKP